MYPKKSWIFIFILCLAGFGLAGDSGRILFLGDSITAGYGIGKDRAFPALIQKRIDEKGLGFKVINAGVSGDTTAGGLRRLNWVLREPIQILVLELGANDGLRGLPLGEMSKNLQAIINQVKDKNPNVSIVLAGMRLPPNLGREYTAEFEAVFSELAEKNKTAFIPFILEGVAGDPSLNLPDRIHPTPEGHRILAETVWNSLHPLLKK